MSHEPHVDVHAPVPRMQIQVLPLSVPSSLSLFNRRGKMAFGNLKRGIDDICPLDSAVPLIHAKEICGFSF